jgi:Ran-binding protein 1
VQEATEESHDPQFEPVIRLTETVAASTHEENEDVLFKM